MSMTVSILGCGWLGKGLALSLIKEGHRVKGSTTTADKMDTLSQLGIEPYLININAGSLESYDHSFFDCEVFIVAFNVKLQSRPEYPAEIRNLIHSLQHHKVPRILFISSISVYGNHNLEVNELTAPDPQTVSAKFLCQAEEMLLAEKELSVTTIRFGGLIGPARMPGRFLSGKKDIPDGLSPVNLIHMDDCTGLILALIESGLSFPVLNAVAPDHPAKQDFYGLAARMEGLPAPEFIAENKHWKIVGSSYTDRFYSYRINNLLSWLEQHPTSRSN
jgi:nucleoside-diphosphate-sugar epimerase